MGRRFNALVVGVAFALGASLLACGDDDADGRPTATPDPSPTIAAPSETPEATPTPDRGAGTGIEVVDDILDAVRVRDFAALNGMVQSQPVPCTTTLEGIGGPPRCRAGEADGTPVEVIFGASCEGFYVRQDELPFARSEYGTGVAAGEELYGVYRITGASQLARLWPDALYAVILNRVQPDDAIFATAILTSNQGIVGFTDGCGQSPQDFVQTQGLTDAIVPPG